MEAFLCPDLAAGDSFALLYTDAQAPDGGFCLSVVWADWFALIPPSHLISNSMEVHSYENERFFYPSNA